MQKLTRENLTIPTRGLIIPTNMQKTPTSKGVLKEKEDRDISRDPLFLATHHLA